MAAFPLLTDPFILAAVALLVAAAVLLLLTGRKPWLSRLRRKPLLITNEAEFFHRLQRALLVYPWQVTHSCKPVASGGDNGHRVREANRYSYISGCHETQ
jgi:hypothetical protein